MAIRYLVALGGNLGDPAALFEKALAMIAERVGPVTKRSRWRMTPPLLDPGAPADEVQPPYLNGAVEVKSDLPPLAVLRALLDIERRLGRVREGRRWQPRLIDLDLLAADGLVLEDEELVLPHPELHRRTFVLEPLIDIAPDWEHPLLRRTARELLSELDPATP